MDYCTVCCIPKESPRHSSLTPLHGNLHTLPNPQNDRVDNSFDSNHADTHADNSLRQVRADNNNCWAILSRTLILKPRNSDLAQYNILEGSSLFSIVENPNGKYRRNHQVLQSGLGLTVGSPHARVQRHVSLLHVQGHDLRLSGEYAAGNTFCTSIRGLLPNDLKSEGTVRRGSFILPVPLCYLSST